MSKTQLIELIQEQRLPDDFMSTVERWYTPIAQNIAAIATESDASLVIGVQGCQGSGKSTLSEFLKVLLESEHGLPVAVLSIDDFYLTKAEREVLARSTHPLLATRGVPGTHDVTLALNTISALTCAEPSENILIPRFNKATDDRQPEPLWDITKGPVKLVILEGWCIGLSSQGDSDLIPCINELESKEDTDLTWRKFVNEQLEKDYKTLFDMLDALVVLKAPSFNSVYQWRLLQEQKLIEKLASSDAKSKNKTMSPDEILRFISHYQRLTEHALNTLPERADWLLELADDHSIVKLSSKSGMRNK